MEVIIVKKNLNIQGHCLLLRKIKCHTISQQPFATSTVYATKVSYTISTYPHTKTHNTWIRRHICRKHLVTGEMPRSELKRETLGGNKGRNRSGRAQRRRWGAGEMEEDGTLRMSEGEWQPCLECLCLRRLIFAHGFCFFPFSYLLLTERNEKAHSQQVT